MPKNLPEGACYAGRAPGVVPCNFSMTREAYDFLCQIAPTRKGFGQVISRLLLEERARMVQRVVLRQAITDECADYWAGCDGELDLSSANAMEILQQSREPAELLMG